MEKYNKTHKYFILWCESRLISMFGTYYDGDADEDEQNCSKLFNDIGNLFSCLYDKIDTHNVILFIEFPVGAASIMYSYAHIKEVLSGPNGQNKNELLLGIRQSVTKNNIKLKIIDGV